MREVAIRANCNNHREKLQWNKKLSLIIDEESCKMSVWDTQLLSLINRDKNLINTWELMVSR